MIAPATMDIENHSADESMRRRRRWWRSASSFFSSLFTSGRWIIKKNSPRFNCYFTKPISFETVDLIKWKFSTWLHAAASPNGNRISSLLLTSPRGAASRHSGSRHRVIPSQKGLQSLISQNVFNCTRGKIPLWEERRASAYHTALWGGKDTAALSLNIYLPASDFFARAGLISRPKSAVAKFALPRNCVGALITFAYLQRVTSHATRCAARLYTLHILSDLDEEAVLIENNLRSAFDKLNHVTEKYCGLAFRGNCWVYTLAAWCQTGQWEWLREFSTKTYHGTL